MEENKAEPPRLRQYAEELSKVRQLNDLIRSMLNEETMKPIEEIESADIPQDELAGIEQEHSEDLNNVRKIYKAIRHLSTIVIATIIIITLIETILTHSQLPILTVSLIAGLLSISGIGGTIWLDSRIERGYRKLERIEEYLSDSADSVKARTAPTLEPYEVYKKRRETDALEEKGE